MNITNKEHEIVDKIIEKIILSDKVYIAISFITDKALKHLIKKVKEKTDLNKKEIKFITTTENYITDYSVLKFLFDKKIETSIINKDDKIRSFHSKFILFNINGKWESMVGSLNMTENAFFHKFENVVFQNETNGLIDDFNFLFDYGKKLDKTFLEEYKDLFETYKKAHKLFFEDIEKKLNLKPNTMQNKVLDELNIVRTNGNNRALLYAATGTGKTYLSAFDVKKGKYKKVLFIVHNRTIIKSAKRDYENIFLDKDCREIFTYNKKFIKDADICFTTEKTIEKILSEDKKILDNFDYVIFDEAHKIGRSNIQGKIFNKLKDRKDIFILGMTATPNRSDDPSYLIEQFQNVVGKIDTKDAIDLGLICKFNFYGADVDVEFGEKDLSNNSLNLMIDKFVDELSKRKVWDGSKIKGLIFVKTIKEADFVSEEMTKRGFFSQSVHSNSNIEDDVISDYIKNLENESNKLNFLVTINKFNEGVDIPKINTIGMFRFTDSNIIYTQQIGRGLRIAGNKNKELNIIDLVGNYRNNFERIVGLSGKSTLNPKEILKIVYDREQKIENYIDFELSEKSRELILKSMSSLTYHKFFKEKLFEVSKLFQSKITLSDLEEVLDEKIQLISNNLKIKKTNSLGDYCWLSILYGNLDYKIKMSDEEHQIIELFSWMPINASTPEEKENILKLMSGQEVSLPYKWHSYFIGENIFTKKRSQLVRGDFKEWFYSEGEKLKFINKLSSKDSLFLMGEIKNYLIKNIKRNDKLVPDFWYSKAEVGFMAGHTHNEMKGKFSKSKYDNSLTEKEIFLTNTVSKKGGTTYKNEIITRNEFVISNDKAEMFSDPYEVHNFLGNELFNKWVLYKYIGKPEKIEWHDKEYTKESLYSELKINKEYYRFNITTKELMNENDFIYFKYLN